MKIMLQELLMFVTGLKEVTQKGKDIAITRSEKRNRNRLLSLTGDIDLKQV
jgi:hypothetical protein